MALVASMERLVTRVVVTREVATKEGTKEASTEVVVTKEIEDAAAGEVVVADHGEVVDIEEVAEVAITTVLAAAVGDIAVEVTVATGRASQPVTDSTCPAKTADLVPTLVAS